jgi:hypothetical protein
MNERDLAPDLSKAQREDSRWRILRTLDAGRPFPLTERVVWRVLTDIKLPMVLAGVRREIAYLEAKGLVKVLNPTEPELQVELTALGIDVLEYTVDCPPGIARPPKWW